jgi:hypothetical protein
MSLAIITDIEQLGFCPAQFGDPEDWARAGGLVDRVIEQAAATLRSTMGASSYDSIAADTASDEHTLLREAESYLAGAKLWLRLESYERSRVTVNRGTADQESRFSRQIENSVQFEDRCWAALGELGVSRSMGFSVGRVSTDSLSGEQVTA